MQYFNDGRFRQQVRFLRRQFLQDGVLPFSNVLSDRAVGQLITCVSPSHLSKFAPPPGA
jgi:hypothetical protein